jgi:NUDIX domain
MQPTRLTPRPSRPFATHTTAGTTRALTLAASAAIHAIGGCTSDTTNVADAAATDQSTQTTEATTEALTPDVGETPSGGGPLGDRPRRGSSDVWLVGWPCSIPPMHEVVVAALDREGQVLLVHRSPNRRAYLGVWDLPGGHVETGETELAALTREMHVLLRLSRNEFGQQPVQPVGCLAPRLAQLVAAVGQPHTPLHPSSGLVAPTSGRG